MSTHRQTENTPNLEQDGQVTPLARSHQSGQPSIHEPSLSLGACELRLGPPRSPPPAPTYEIGSSRRPARIINSGSAQPTIVTASGSIEAPFRLVGGRPVIPLGPGGEHGYLHLFPPINLAQGYPPSDPANNEVSDDTDDPIIFSPTPNRRAIESRIQTALVTYVGRAEDSSRNQRRRLDLELKPPGVNFEGSSTSMPVAPPPSLPPPPHPSGPVPVFNCPICLNPLTEDTTATKCGHVFCDSCIRMAITAQAKCPVCRIRLTQRNLLRIFFSTI